MRDAARYSTSLRVLYLHEFSRMGGAELALLRLIEAIAAGKPVVGTTVGGIPEAVRHGETGPLVPPRAPGRLAEAVITVLKDPVLATSMEEAGRARAQEVFSLENETRQTRAVYDKIVGGRRQSRSGDGGEAGS